jgi:glycosyltransferase involved in cell wall biosynthesis
MVVGDILNQTYEDFDLIIVDDASTDDTLTVVSEFRDPRIQYYRNDHNLGLYPNFNRCLELAHGEYVAIYHNHDRYQSTIIERCVDLLDRYPGVGFVHTGTVTKRMYSDDDHFFVRNWKTVENGKSFAHKMLHHWDSLIHQPTVMARRSIYEKVGNFDEKTYDSSADTATWMKMCSISDIGYIPRPLMRITPRISQDYYGHFSWLSVRGMSRVHHLGLDLLYPAECIKKKIYRSQLNFSDDVYFFRYLMQWLAEGETSLVEQGLIMISEECSRMTNFFSEKVVSLLNFIRPMLQISSSVYRKYVIFMDKTESRRGLKNFYHQGDKTKHESTEINHDHR